MDIVTLGETMLRFSVSRGQNLEVATSYQVDIAGAESNVAINLARLGLKTGWISRLPDNPLGRKVASEMGRHGVDLTGVIWASGGERQSTFFIEFASPPRSTQVIYDRAASAFSHIQPDQVDWTYLRAGHWLHLSGITPALGAGPRATVERAIAEASRAGMTISFDVNYRAKLWSAEQAASQLVSFMSSSTLLVCALRDAVTLFQVPEAAEAAVTGLHARFRPRLTVLTLGDAGAVAFNGELHYQAALPAETVDPIGSGDAFVSGFIAGYLEGGVRRGLQFGVGLAALKRTYQGDVVWCSRQDLLLALNEGSARGVDR
jgi:2-dehydro-3-deoxygluconokinase